MKSEIIIIKTLILIILGICLMSFTKVSEDNEGKAKLVFLHERAFRGEEVEIKINNQRIIDLPSNRYFEIEVNAEKINIIVDRHSRYGEPDIQANLTAESDKVYYLKIYREIDYFTNKLYLVRISEQTAKKTMRSMKLEKNPLENE